MTCRKLRLLCIDERPDSPLDLQDMDAVTAIETLIVRSREENHYFAAEINAVIERNKSTLKNVHIWESGRWRNEQRMLEVLVACQFLTLKSDVRDRGMRHVDATVTLMLISTTLREVTAQLIAEGDVPVIAKALEMNCSLTKLSLKICTGATIKELFTALEVNKNLKELLLCGTIYVEINCIQSVASALKENQCLRTLSIEGVSFHDGEGLDQWSEALSKNCTLQFLCVSGRIIPISNISTLCKALLVNNSLETMKVSEVSGTEEEITTLARQLLEDKCYDRVQLEPWTEPYLRILAPVLASPQAYTRELWLSDIDQLSHDRASILFTALASNKKVNRITLTIGRDSDQKVALLCEMLETNTSIDYLWIRILKENAWTLSFSVESTGTARSASSYLFFGHSCLVANLAETTGMSDAEAWLVADAAENRRREWYLTLAGVVRRSVVCWPADVTQIDALNSDCWRAIARYLMVTDIASG
ncbi:hypothetical protein MTO96_043371 [Rhipicephalus appendiculatus]